MSDFIFRRQYFTDQERRNRGTKRIRRLILMAISTLFIAITVSGTALAAGKHYVPTEEEMYIYSDKKWTKTDETFSASFSKDGKIKKQEVHRYGRLERKTDYKWKGNYLSKTIETDNKVNAPKTTIQKRQLTFKSGKLVKNELTTTYGSSERRWTATFKWNKNKGTQTSSNGDIFTVTLKNGRKSKVEKKKENNSSVYTYYGNYLLKKDSYKSDGHLRETKYNKYGLPVSETEKFDNTKFKTTLTDKWTIKNGVPKEVVITRRDQEPGNDNSHKYKWVFTKTKRVSKLRNCDRYGNLTDLYLPAIS